MRDQRYHGVVVLVSLLGALACADPGTPLVAKRISSRAELPGGPKQYGDPGDFLLENSRIRAVVLDAGHQVSPALWGGALVDLDLVRPWKDLRGGTGLDQFFLTLPMVNINAPHPEKGQVEALRTRDAAIVRVTGRGDRMLALLNLMDMAAPIGLVTRFVMRTDYELPRDAAYLKVTTTFRAAGESACGDKADDDGDGTTDCDDADCSLDPACPDWCAKRKCAAGTTCDPFWAGCLPSCGEAACPGGGSCDEATGLCIGRSVAMDDLAPGTDLTDVLSGGLLKLLSRIPGELTRKPGYVAGDMALFGASLYSFAPGLGFEIDAQYRLMFIRGRNALLDPLSFDFLAGTGDRVSYAYFSLDGAVLFPFATESLTGSMTHGLNCLQSTDDDAVCDDVPFVRFTRYLAVGEGDVASVLDTVFDLRKTPHGRVEGQVIDGKTGKPASGADVFAVADPCDAKNCLQVPAGCGSFDDYAGLAAAARACTRAPDNPDGRAMIESQFRTDRGVTLHPSGSYSGPLKPGAWWLVARLGKGPISRPARVEVKEGRTTYASLVLPEPGRLKYRVLDEAGRPIPARITVGHCFPECSRDTDCPEGQACDGEFQCRPKSPCSAGADCDHDEVCSQGKCACRLAKLPGEAREELGDGYMSDRKAAMAVSVTGEGEVVLPPARYDVIFSHGMEYEIDSRSVELVPGAVVFVDARVTRAVDTRGWISVDQHVHTSGSPDSGTPMDLRLASAVADGLEVMAMTDHDYISDPGPLLRQMGLQPAIAAFTGEEVSTLDVSHLIGWPLAYTNEKSDHGAMSWAGRTSREVFAWIRAHGAISPGDTLVVVPHPRGGMSSYYDVFAQNPFTLALEPGMIQESTPLLDPANFAQEYDLVEILNSKRLDITRMPTYAEVRDFNVMRREMLATLKDSPREEVLAMMAPPSWEIVRRTLARTPAEHDAHWKSAGKPACVVPPGCSTDADCKDGKKCTGSLCLAPCAKVEECPSGQSCHEGRCEIPDDTPCDAVKGLTDDWLRMIDHGVFKPGVGGSDVHGVANYEMGCLRNYLRYDDDDPAALDGKTLIGRYREGRSFATYGPFVELTVDGRGPGETAALGGRKSVDLHVRVQSPLWFDVSRVEVYRNGHLEWVFDADAKDPTFRIAVPNDSVVNVDATIPISPDEDSWFVAMAMGVKGRAMNPVYGSSELPPVYLGDLFSSIFGALPISLPSYIISPKIPVYYPQFPFAITNPVYLDVDGPDSRGCMMTPASHPTPAWACNYPKEWPKERKPCVCD